MLSITAALVSRCKADAGRATTALAGVGATVVAVQALSFVANLLVVRALSVPEYALLTSSMSILGLLTAIADSGLSQAALTVGGLHHHSEREKAEVLQRCRALILKTGIAASVLVVPVWMWMASRLDTGLVSAFWAGVFLFGGFFFVLGVNIFKSFLLLEGKRALTQKVEVARTLVRVLILALGVGLFPNAAFVIACGALAEFGGWLLFRNSLSQLLRSPVECGRGIRAEISGVFWRLMPSTIYKALSSQIFLLLLIAFGSTASVAGAGALSRFHQFFMFVPSVVANLLNPRLARAVGSASRNRKLLVYSAVGWTGALLTWAALVAFAGPLLALFGPEYAGLQNELRILMSGSCLFVMNGVLIGLLNTRGWILPPAILIASDLLFSVLAILTCNVATLHGFTVMNCVVHGGALATTITWAVFRYAGWSGHAKENSQP